MSVTLNFHVCHQNITRADSCTLVADSLNYAYAHFDFCSSDWDGLIKTAVFTRGQDTYEQILEDDQCLIPWEVLPEGKGIFTVSVFAGNRITTNVVKVKLDASGWSFALESSQPPTEGVYSQILTRLADVEDTVVESAESAAQSAASATESAQSAEQSMEAARTAKSEAEESAASVTQYSKTSESWAVGGTGTRTGEDTDNSKYYAEQAGAASRTAVSAGNAATGAAQAATQAAGSASQSAQIAAEGAQTVQELYDGAVSDIAAAKTAAVGAIQAKGDQVLDSIPEDYTELSGDVTQLKADLNGNLKRSNLSDTYQSDQINVLTSENDLNDCLTPNVYRTSVGTLHAPTNNMNYHVIVFLSKWQNNTRKAITQIAISSANTQILYIRTASINASNVVSWNNDGNWTKINFDVSQIGSGSITRDKLSDYYQSNIPLMTTGDFNTVLVASNVRVGIGVTNTPDSTKGWFIVTTTIPWDVTTNPRRNLIQTAYEITDPTNVYIRIYDSGGGGVFKEWTSLGSSIIAKANVNGIKGKKIVLMGDSTYAITGTDNGGHIAQILASLGDCTVYDCSFGGTRMSDSRGASSADSYKYFDFPKLVDAIIANDFTDQDDHLSGKGAAYTINLATLKAVDWSNVDILCIEYGANDFSGGVPLGDYTSNRETYTGAFIYCINALLTAYPNLHIVADGVRFRNWASAGTGLTAFNYENSINLKTGDYADALEQVSGMYGIPFFENLKHYGWNLYNWSYYFGTSEAHFNVNGTKYAADALFRNLCMLGFAQNL